MNAIWFCCFVKQIGKRRQKNKIVLIEPPVKYSHFKKRNINPKSLNFECQRSSLLVRLPGEIDGQEFSISDCHDSTIYLLDCINTIMIDDCTNCKILTGPVKNSVFVRDCTGCYLMTSCQQFRARDCRDSVIFLSCMTQPAIESCTTMAFGPLNCFYTGLSDQFKAAGLNIFNTIWSEIYDFTPDETGMSKNCRLMSSGEDARNYFQTPEQLMENFKDNNDKETIDILNKLTEIDFSLNPEDSLVPVTLCHPDVEKEFQYGTDTKDIVLIIFFESSTASDCAKYVAAQIVRQPDCHLLRTRCTHLSEFDLMKMFGLSESIAKFKSGTTIVFEVIGPVGLVKQVCQQSISDIPLNYDPDTIYALTDQADVRDRIALLDCFYRTQRSTI